MHRLSELPRVRVFLRHKEPSLVHSLIFFRRCRSTTIHSMHSKKEFSTSSCRTFSTRPLQDSVRSLLIVIIERHLMLHVATNMPHLQYPTEKDPQSFSISRRCDVYVFRYYGTRLFLKPTAPCSRRIETLSPYFDFKGLNWKRSSGFK